MVLPTPCLTLKTFLVANIRCINFSNPMLFISSLLYEVVLVALLKRSTTCRYGSRCVFTVSNKKIPSAYFFKIKEAVYIAWEKAALNKQAEEAIIAISI